MALGNQGISGTAGRNHPCPCGSGKRYKHCCGLVGLAGQGQVRPPSMPQPAEALSELMQEALRQQVACDFEEADRLYGRALALQPRNFDALHMQGVVAYQRKQYVRADALIRAALKIAPDSQAARFNLDLVGREFAIENEFCKYMLPFLADRCRSVPPRLPSGLEVHFLIDPDGMRDTLMPCLPLLRQIAEGYQDSTWWNGGVEGEGGALGLEPELRRPDDSLAGGHLIVVGTHFKLAAPIVLASFEHITLLCDAPAYCEIADRIEYLNAAGDRPLSLWFASETLRVRSGLPGVVLVNSLQP